MSIFLYKKSLYRGIISRRFNILPAAIDIIALIIYNDKRDSITKLRR